MFWHNFVVKYITAFKAYIKANLQHEFLTPPLFETFPKIHPFLERTAFPKQGSQFGHDDYWRGPWHLPSLQSHCKVIASISRLKLGVTAWSNSCLATRLHL